MSDKTDKVRAQLADTLDRKRVVRTEVLDPATHGFANSPTLKVYVDFDPFDSGLWVSKYYFGQGDQYNEITPGALAEMLTSVPPSALIDKHIWKVDYLYGVKVPDEWDSSVNKMRPPEPITMIAFCTWAAHKCLEYTQHGAFRAMLTDEVALFGGWSSRPSVFNTTGIVQQHYMDATLMEVSDGSRTRVGTSVCVPVHWGARSVKTCTNSFYEVVQATEGNDSPFKPYLIARSLSKLAALWNDRSLTSLPRS